MHVSKNDEVSPPKYGKYDLAVVYQQCITINDSKSHHGSRLYLNYWRELIKKAIGDWCDNRFLWFISHIVLYFCTQLLSFYVIDLQDLSCIIPCFYSLSHREISSCGDTPRSYMDHATNKRNQYQFPCWNLALDSLACMLWETNYLPWFFPSYHLEMPIKLDLQQDFNPMFTPWQVSMINHHGYHVKIRLNSQCSVLNHFFYPKCGILTFFCLT